MEDNEDKKNTHEKTRENEDRIGWTQHERTREIGLVERSRMWRNLSPWTGKDNHHSLVQVLCSGSPCHYPQKKTVPEHNLCERL